MHLLIMKSFQEKALDSYKLKIIFCFMLFVKKLKL